MSTWSASPFGGVVPQSELVLGELLAENNGESRRVCRLNSHQEWLFKEYRTEASAADVQRLDRLIALPATMKPEERSLIDANTSWPVVRVVDGPRTVGVCLPHAPIGFFAPMRVVNGKTRTKAVPIDLLAQTDQRIQKLGLAVPSRADRLAACASLAAIGALFERHGLAYLDWSYANAFWDCSSHVAYVIDVDGCSFGPRWQTETRGWEDPLVPLRTLADNHVDRYRVALLIARCLSGERELPQVREAVRRLADDPWTAAVGQQLDRSLNAATLPARPSLQLLARTLELAVHPAPAQRSASPRPDSNDGSGVVEWRPVRKRVGVPSPAGAPPPRSDAPTGPARRPDQARPSTPTTPTRPLRVPPPATPPTPRVPARPPSNTPAPSRSSSLRGVAIGTAILALLLLIAIVYALNI
jgi:hypothetical protein